MNCKNFLKLKQLQKKFPTRNLARSYNKDQKNQDWSGGLLKNKFFKKLSDSLSKVEYKNFTMLGKVEDVDDQIHQTFELIGKKTVEYINLNRNPNSSLIRSDLVYKGYEKDSIAMEYSKMGAIFNVYEKDEEIPLKMQVLAENDGFKISILEIRVFKGEDCIFYLKSNYFFMI